MLPTITRSFRPQATHFTRQSSKLLRLGGLSSSSIASHLFSSTDSASVLPLFASSSYLSKPAHRRSFTSSSALLPSSAPSTDFNPFPTLITSHPSNNVSPAIAGKIGTNLHLQKNHPLNIIKNIIERHFNESAHVSPGDPTFATFDSLPPIVTTAACFDSLLIKPDHVSRSSSDTYYLDDVNVLRTHTSAHQSELISAGETAFLCTGDVYRRDEVDVSHYPVFHQMEGVRIFDEGTSVSTIESDLKNKLTLLAVTLFGDVEMRWVDTYFPFTDPSFELEIFFNNEWLEVLGCGVMRQEIITAAGAGNKPGWAFGLGLERLAMVLFEIPDIRLFWSKDKRFSDQFDETNGTSTVFKPYSKFPICYKDVAFWTSREGQDQNSATFHPNDLFEIVRNVCPKDDDLVETIELIDEFVHPKTNRKSNCYRINYRSMDRSLTNEEIDRLQEEVRKRLVEELGVVLR